MLDEKSWFGEDVHEARARSEEAACERSSVVLEISVLWREHLLSVQTFERPRNIHVGTHARCDVILDDDILPGARFPLLTHRDGCWHLVAFYGLEATLLGEQRRLTVSALLAREAFKEHPDWHRTALIRLGPDPQQDDFHGVSVSFGEVRLIARHVNPEARHGKLGAVDATPLPFISASALLHIAMMVIILSVPPGITHLHELAPAPPQDRLVQAIVIPPRVPLPHTPQGQDLQGDGQDDALARRHKHEEGAAGARTSQPPPSPHTGRLSVQKRDALAALSARASGSESVLGAHEAGVLGVLSGAGELMGSARKSSGDEALSAMGELADMEAGRAAGEEGLGTSGTGRGAGEAMGESIGLAHAIGVERAGLGGQGVAPRLTRRAVELEDIYFRSDVEGEKPHKGCLTPKMIKRAIARRRSQIRTCYESQLLHQRDLSGIVNISMTIEQSGKVSRVEIIENSTRSAAISRCLEHKLKTLAFPSFDQCEQVVVSHPFNFHPKQLLILPRH